MDGALTVFAQLNCASKFQGRTEQKSLTYTYKLHYSSTHRMHIQVMLEREKIKGQTLRHKEKGENQIVKK